MSNDMNIDFVLRTVEKRDIRFVRLWFTDILGNLKSFSISPAELEEAFEEGIGFDGSSVDGFTPPQESDMLAFPVADTFQILPWRPSSSGVARIFCDIRTPEGARFEGDPRSCLTRVFEEAEQRGLVPNVGPKIEYFYFGDQENPIPVDHAGYFDLTPYDSARDLRRSTTLMLEKMSIPVTYSYHSNAPSQNGIELGYCEAVSCADNIMTARLVIKQEANEQGLFASFMPKPLAGYSGSAMFLYQSLFDTDGNNLFWGTEDYHLSSLAHHYIAGILHYAPEFALVTNPTVNSYKRLVQNGEVPVYTTWGRRNRSALVRLPAHKPGKHLSARIELRNPDPTANPYLALAVTIAAGLKGIEDELPLPPEVTSGDLSEALMAQKGYRHLPKSLGEAIETFEQSELMRKTLGDHICDFLVTEKRSEWTDYCTTITDWEKDRYYAGF
ncbi:MAG: glutamine synthetase family protein [Coriobacteriales bacterium]|nr:glutamine synthetase family protein [Coriobacteriales bacterium]